MRWTSKIAAAALAALLQACVSAPANAPQTANAAVEQRTPVTILVSIDGFRADYLDRGITPNLTALAREGVRAAVRPSFPSKTFPNHYTLVTGLRPDRNGIVANRMEDAARPGELFTMATDDPFWWNQAEPIWAAAEQAGIRTATMFWPGSNVAVGGVQARAWPNRVSGGTRPGEWQQFNMQVPDAQRVRAVLDWMRRPAADRPGLVTLYFDSVDTEGHLYGPDAAGTNAAIAEIDQRIGELVAGLKALGQPVNLVVTADHGMAARSRDRVVLVEALASAGDYRLIESGPYASFEAVPGREAALEARLLRAHDHVRCWRRGEIPPEFHYGRNPRVPAYFCLADLGWQIEEKPPGAGFDGGNHGWDHRAPEMAAVFVAAGPAFRPGGTLATFDNVDIYPLLRGLIGLPPATDIDGSAAVFEPVLAP